MPVLDSIPSMIKGVILSNIIIALILLVVGIVVGRVIYYILKRLLNEARIEKTKSYGFFKAFMVIIKWSIYILFLDIAIKKLGIPEFTNWITDVLVVIPALVGALILIIIGFVIATYLRNSVEESKIEGWKILSNIFFLFILYVFLTFALKTALISIDSTTVNIILIILTAATALGAALYYAKKKY